MQGLLILCVPAAHLQLCQCNECMMSSWFPNHVCSIIAPLYWLPVCKYTQHSNSHFHNTSLSPSCLHWQTVTCGLSNANPGLPYLLTCRFSNLHISITGLISGCCTCHEKYDTLVLMRAQHASNCLLIGQTTSHMKLYLQISTQGLSRHPGWCLSN